MDESGKAFYTQSLTRLTPELQWDKKVFDKIVTPQMDTSMNEDYVEEEHIGKTITDEIFTGTKLNEKQSAHRLYYNNKEQRQLPQDLDNADLHSTEHPEHPEDITTTRTWTTSTNRHLHTYSPWRTMRTRLRRRT
eukprot:3932714-Amphidinium_carterae.1